MFSSFPFLTCFLVDKKRNDLKKSMNMLPSRAIMCLRRRRIQVCICVNVFSNFTCYIAGEIGATSSSSYMSDVKDMYTNNTKVFGTSGGTGTDQADIREQFNVCLQLVYFVIVCVCRKMMIRQHQRNGIYVTHYVIISMLYVQCNFILLIHSCVLHLKMVQ
jgi:hypothetical protein